MARVLLALDSRDYQSPLRVLSGCIKIVVEAVSLQGRVARAPARGARHDTMIR